MIYSPIGLKKQWLKIDRSISKQQYKKDTDYRKEQSRSIQTNAFLRPQIPQIYQKEISKKQKSIEPLWNMSISTHKFQQTTQSNH